MNSHTRPTPRKLVFIWLVLMALSLATMLAGKITSIETVGPAWMLILMAVTWIKANLILRYYLELNAASGGWNKVFNAIISLIIVILFGLYASTSLFKQL